MTKLIVLWFMGTLLLPGISMAGDRNLPSMLTITFDDGSLSQYTHGLRLAKQFGIRGTIFVTTGDLARVSSDGSYAISWEQANDFLASGWEVGSHTVTHRSLTDLSAAEVVEEYRSSFEQILQETGVAPVSISAPFGNYNEATIDAALDIYQYHAHSWGGYEGFNPVSEVEARLISRLNIDHDMSAKQVCGEIFHATRTDTWLVLLFHQFVEGEPSEYQLSTSVYTEILSCIQSLEVHGLLETVTLKEGMDRVKKRTH